jgi:5-methylcytosine-specific restriction endonuclease McrA
VILGLDRTQNFVTVDLLLDGWMKTSFDNPTIKKYLKKMSKNEYDLDPWYQRGDELGSTKEKLSSTISSTSEEILIYSSAWPLSMKQNLIKSIMDGYDLPKFYFWKDPTNKYQIIDGKQRSLAISCFCLDKSQKNAFYIEIDGQQKFFDDLDTEQKDKILDAQLTFSYLTDCEETDARKLFTRLQSGIRLFPDEVRHAIGGKVCNYVAERAYTQDVRFPYRKPSSSRWFRKWCAGCGGRKTKREDIIAKLLLLEIYFYSHKHVWWKISDDELVDWYYKDEKIGINKFIKRSFENKEILMDSAFGSVKTKLPNTETIMYGSWYLITYLREYYALPDNEIVQHLQSMRNEIDKLFTAAKNNVLTSDQQRHYSSLTNHNRIKDGMRSTCETYIKMFEETNTLPLSASVHGSFTSKQKDDIFEHDEGICQQCGIKVADDINHSTWHADHVYPKSKGGPTIVSNGRLLCPNCNEHKNDTIDNSLAKPIKLVN